MKDLKCDTCGNLTYALCDGYAIGDTLLEGILFEIRLTNHGNVLASVQEKDLPYFRSQRIDRAQWEKDMAEHASVTDTLTCPMCEADIDGPGAGESPSLGNA